MFLSQIELSSDTSTSIINEYPNNFEKWSQVIIAKNSYQVINALKKIKNLILFPEKSAFVTKL